MTELSTDHFTHCARTVRGGALTRGGFPDRRSAQRYADKLNETAARMGLHTRYAAHLAIGRPVPRPVADPTEEPHA
jgi:hypothetical protein